MSETLKSRIIQTLVSSLKIPKKDIDEAIEWQRTKGISVERTLLEKGLVKEEDIMVLLVKELHIPFINLKKYKIDPGLKELISERMARQHRMIPISRMENNITVAMADPLNIFAIDDAKTFTGHEIDVVMSTESDILRAIEAYYGGGSTLSVKDVSKEISIDEFEIISEQVKSEDVSADEGEEAPIIRLVNMLIKEALRQRASDIHVEPLADAVRVRYRIDGILQDAFNLPKQNQNAVTVRLKIMSRMDITDTRTPQDGRFKMRTGQQEVDFRVSALPTIFGQKIVLRVLDKKSLGIGLDGLGFSGRPLEIMKAGIHQPFGMFLVTGPTGSGKSTTLYSIINELNTVDKNIITVEDPVEYLIEGLTQIQVRSEIGLSFASGLRAILRQSPDVVMVGEIRDAETADIAIKASLTGQLVFSTLHTNDAAGALTRLVDMGVEPFLVASSLVLVCAQRLCRRICPRCAAEIEVPAKALSELKYSIPKGAKFYEGKGCAFCRQTGYHGRAGITEVLQIDDVVRDMLVRGKSSDEIKNYAREKQEMTVLFDDAMKKCLKGETTISEVLRVTASDL